jgi:hypothetical protein
MQTRGTQRALPPFCLPFASLLPPFCLPVVSLLPPVFHPFAARLSPHFSTRSSTTIHPRMFSDGWYTGRHCALQLFSTIKLQQQLPQQFRHPSPAQRDASRILNRVL